MKNKQNLEGKVYGRLTVIKEATPRKRKDGKGTKRYWLCKCICGNEKEISQEQLVSYRTQSCGCYMKERAATLNPNITGVTKEYKRLYKIWRGMIDRCYNPNDMHHRDYYDRGITICPEWRHDFIAFKEWAFSHGYNETLTIDRIDVNGNYEPDNCRWATNKQQQNNKRNNVRYNYNGEQLTLSEIADRCNIEYGTLEARILRYNYTLEEAISKPVRRCGRKKK